MAKNENKTQPTEIKVADFIRQSDPKKVDDSFELVEIMEKLSGEPATMWGPSIIGFGKYHYTYASGRQGEMCRIGFSPRKDKFSLYVTCDADFRNDLVEQLGKIKQTKGCIYFKKLDDLNRGVLEELIKASLEDSREKWG